MEDIPALQAAVEEATPAKPPKDAFKVSTESNIVDVTSESIDEHVPVFVDAPNAFENTPDAFENTPATPVNVNVTADGEAIAEATMSDVDVGEGDWDCDAVNGTAKNVTPSPPCDEITPL